MLAWRQTSVHHLVFSWRIQHIVTRYVYWYKYLSFYACVAIDVQKKCAYHVVVFPPAVDFAVFFAIAGHFGTIYWLLYSPLACSTRPLPTVQHGE